MQTGSQKDKHTLSHERLMEAVELEGQKFREFYVWLEKYMPHSFFEEMDLDNVILVAHNLMAFDLQDHFSTMNLKKKAVVMCLDSPDADVRILENYRNFGIKNYRTFVSSIPPPIIGVSECIRIAAIHFTEVEEHEENTCSKELEDELIKLMGERNPQATNKDVHALIGRMNASFINAVPPRRLVSSLDMFFRAQTRDNCQYEIRYNETWQENQLPSLEIVFAWRHTPKHAFLFRLARMIHRHDLIMRRVNATYVDPYSRQPILVMSLGLHGVGNRAAWDVADIPDFLRELVILKYFGDFDLFDKTFVSSGLMRGNLCLLLRCMIYFVHQILVNVDPHLYSVENIREALCRHPMLTLKISQAFECKFHPDKVDLETYERLREEAIYEIKTLDTGREVNDIRRRNVLFQGLNFVHYTLKTNFYRNNKTALSFRLDPKYLEEAPFDHKKIYPELPYAIFFVKGMHFFGYHIRFKDLARGGLRTVIPEKAEQMEVERNNIFNECYNLSYTQHKKNKDIPEGGAKGIIFLKPYERLHSEAEIFRHEQHRAGIDENEIQERIERFVSGQRIEYLYQTQRSFVSSILTLINCEEDGTIKAKHVVDYLKRPEYIYLGPDENMHNSMIEWIAYLSNKFDYRPGSAFISSKPKLGINHKQYGVTSLGVNVYMHEVLRYMGIDPEKESFTVKISGGPDGDVAGNQINNLHRYYRTTARLLALTDVSGTIYDPEGLDLNAMRKLFLDGKPIDHYPAEKLNSGGFLLTLKNQRDQTAYQRQTLCLRKEDDCLVEDWVSGNDMNSLFRNNVHQTPVDVFVPAGGRPRTLNSRNIDDYFYDGKPSSKAIVEGANLYITPDARRVLEEAGTLIIRDSSANKAGVICSSFEVLCNLVMGDQHFIEEREQAVAEILERLKFLARCEAKVMLQRHQEFGTRLTLISEQVSATINDYTDQLLNSFESIRLPKDNKHPLIRCLISYCLPILRTRYEKEILERIPEPHKKAIIASHLAAQLVYTRGLDWKPSIVDILPLIWEDPEIAEIKTS